jgi:hypothetical protein
MNKLRCSCGIKKEVGVDAASPGESVDYEPGRQVGNTRCFWDYLRHNELTASSLFDIAVIKTVQ